MKKIQRLALLILSFFVIYNCSDNKCNQSVDVNLKAEVIIKDMSLINSEFIKDLSVFSPDWIDSVHYNSSGYLLELSPFSDTSIFIFTSQGFLDTVWVLSNRQLVLLSQECGFVNNFAIDSVWYSTNNIDSLELINKNLTAQNDGHFKIYF
ncbi:MAG: DUF6452 family protein [Bacteroidales bacterium]|jgi:hypothetical protein|nr:DUF6452 family protein [Bacteroidales bacterium]